MPTDGFAHRSNATGTFPRRVLLACASLVSTQGTFHYTLLVPSTDPAAAGEVNDFNRIPS